MKRITDFLYIFSSRQSAGVYGSPNIWNRHFIISSRMKIRWRTFKGLWVSDERPEKGDKSSLNPLPRLLSDFLSPWRSTGFKNLPSTTLVSWKQIRRRRVSYPILETAEGKFSVEYLVCDIKPRILFSPIFSTKFSQLEQLKKKTNF